MVRTQIYLPDEMHKKLNWIAKKRKEPMAQVVRVLIEEGLNRRKSFDYSGKTAMKNILAIKAKGGPPDLSTNLDHYLYGTPKRKK